MKKIDIFPPNRQKWHIFAHFYAKHRSPGVILNKSESFFAFLGMNNKSIMYCLLCKANISRMGFFAPLDVVFEGIYLVSRKKVFTFAREMNETINYTKQ